jgi:hypothetical protein
VIVSFNTIFCGECNKHMHPKFQGPRYSSTGPEMSWDPLISMCPHLVCSEWKIIFKMRAISKTFWKRFLNTRVGQSFRLCMPACDCKWHHLHYTQTSKRHILLGMSKHMAAASRYKCSCADPAVKERLEKWCTNANLDPAERIINYPCECRPRGLWYEP